MLLSSDSNSSSSVRNGGAARTPRTPSLIRTRSCTPRTPCTQQKATRQCLHQPVTVPRHGPALPVPLRIGLGLGLGLCAMLVPIERQCLLPLLPMLGQHLVRAYATSKICQAPCKHKVGQDYRPSWSTGSHPCAAPHLFQCQAAPSMCRAIPFSM